MAKNQKMASECISQVLECSVCYEQMSDPKMLPCQHTFCVSCLIKTANYNLKKISCAICRSQHNLPNGGVVGFPNNLTLVTLIDSMSDGSPSLTSTLMVLTHLEPKHLRLSNNITCKPLPQYHRQGIHSNRLLAEIFL